MNSWEEIRRSVQRDARWCMAVGVGCLLIAALAASLSIFDDRLRLWCWEVRGEMAEGRCYAPCAPVPCHSPQLSPDDSWSMDPVLD